MFVNRLWGRYVLFGIVTMKFSLRWTRSEKIELKGALLMTAVRRLFFGSVVLLMFMAGGFTAGASEREKVDELIDKVLTQHFTR